LLRLAGILVGKLHEIARAAKERGNRKELILSFDRSLLDEKVDTDAFTANVQE
jgi:hypothetical protein